MTGVSVLSSGIDYVLLEIIKEYQDKVYFRTESAVKNFLNVAKLK